MNLGDFGVLNKTEYKIVRSVAVHNYKMSLESIVNMQIKLYQFLIEKRWPRRRGPINPVENVTTV